MLEEYVTSLSLYYDSDYIFVVVVVVVVMLALASVAGTLLWQFFDNNEIEKSEEDSKEAKDHSAECSDNHNILTSKGKFDSFDKDSEEKSEEVEECDKPVNECPDIDNTVTSEEKDEKYVLVRENVKTSDYDITGNIKKQKKKKRNIKGNELSLQEEGDATAEALNPAKKQEEIIVEELNPDNEHEEIIVKSLNEDNEQEEIIVKSLNEDNEHEEIIVETLNPDNEQEEMIVKSLNEDNEQEEGLQQSTPLLDKSHHIYDEAIQEDHNVNKKATNVQSNALSVAVDDNVSVIHAEHSSKLNIKHRTNSFASEHINIKSKKSAVSINEIKKCESIISSTTNDINTLEILNLQEKAQSLLETETDKPSKEIAVEEYIVADVESCVQSAPEILEEDDLLEIPLDEADLGFVRNVIVFNPTKGLVGDVHISKSHVYIDKKKESFLKKYDKDRDDSIKNENVQLKKDENEMNEEKYLHKNSPVCSQVSEMSPVCYQPSETTVNEGSLTQDDRPFTSIMEKEIDEMEYNRRYKEEDEVREKSNKISIFPDATEEQKNIDLPIKPLDAPDMSAHKSDCYQDLGKCLSERINVVDVTILSDDHILKNQSRSCYVASNNQLSLAKEEKQDLQNTLTKDYRSVTMTDSNGLLKESDYHTGGKLENFKNTSLKDQQYVKTVDGVLLNENISNDSNKPINVSKIFVKDSDEITLKNQSNGKECGGVNSFDGTCESLNVFRNNSDVNKIQEILIDDKKPISSLNLHGKYDEKSVSLIDKTCRETTYEFCSNLVTEDHKETLNKDYTYTSFEAGDLCNKLSSCKISANEQTSKVNHEDNKNVSGIQHLFGNMGQILAMIFDTDNFEDVPLDTVDMLGGRIIISDDGEYAIIDIEGKQKEYKIDKTKLRNSRDFSETIRNSRDLSTLFQELETLDVVGRNTDKRKSLLHRLSVDTDNSDSDNNDTTKDKVFDLHKIVEDIQNNDSESANQSNLSTERETYKHVNSNQPFRGTYSTETPLNNSLETVKVIMNPEISTFQHSLLGRKYKVDNAGNAKSPAHTSAGVNNNLDVHNQSESDTILQSDEVYVLQNETISTSSSDKQSSTTIPTSSSSEQSLTTIPTLSENETLPSLSECEQTPIKETLLPSSNKEHVIANETLPLSSGEEEDLISQTFHTPSNETLSTSSGKEKAVTNITLPSTFCEDQVLTDELSVRDTVQTPNRGLFTDNKMSYNKPNKALEHLSNHNKANIETTSPDVSCYNDLTTDIYKNDSQSLEENSSIINLNTDYNKCGFQIAHKVVSINNTIRDEQLQHKIKIDKNVSENIVDTSISLETTELSESHTDTTDYLSNYRSQSHATNSLRTILEEGPESNINQTKYTHSSFALNPVIENIPKVNIIEDCFASSEQEPTTVYNLEEKHHNLIEGSIDEETYEDILHEKSTTELLSDLKYLLATEERDISRSIENLLHIEDDVYEAQTSDDLFNSPSNHPVLDKTCPLDASTESESENPVDRPSEYFKLGRNQDPSKDQSLQFSPDRITFLAQDNDNIIFQQKSKSLNDLDLDCQEKKLEFNVFNNPYFEPALLRSQSMEMVQKKPTLVLSSNVSNVSPKIKETNLDALLSSLKNNKGSCEVLLAINDKVVPGNYETRDLSNGSQDGLSNETPFSYHSDSDTASETEIDIDMYDMDLDETNIDSSSETDIDAIGLDDSISSNRNSVLETDIDEAIKHENDEWDTNMDSTILSVTSNHCTFDDNFVDKELSDADINIASDLIPEKCDNKGREDTEDDDVLNEKDKFAAAIETSNDDEVRSSPSKHDSIEPIVRKKLISRQERLVTVPLEDSGEYVNCGDGVLSNVLAAYLPSSESTENHKSGSARMKELADDLARFETVSANSDIECLQFTETLMNDNLSKPANTDGMEAESDNCTDIPACNLQEETQMNLHENENAKNDNLEPLNGNNNNQLIPSIKNPIEYPVESIIKPVQVKTDEIVPEDDFAKLELIEEPVKLESDLVIIVNNNNTEQSDAIDKPETVAEVIPIFTEEEPKKTKRRKSQDIAVAEDIIEPVQLRKEESIPGEDLVKLEDKTITILSQNEMYLSETSINNNLSEPNYTDGREAESTKCTNNAACNLQEDTQIILHENEIPNAKDNIIKPIKGNNDVILISSNTDPIEYQVESIIESIQVKKDDIVLEDDLAKLELIKEPVRLESDPVIIVNNNNTEQSDAIDKPETVAEVIPIFTEEEPKKTKTRKSQDIAVAEDIIEPVQLRKEECIPGNDFAKLEDTSRMSEIKIQEHSTNKILDKNLSPDLTESIEKDHIKPIIPSKLAEDKGQLPDNDVCNKENILTEMEIETNELIKVSAPPSIAKALTDSSLHVENPTGNDAYDIEKTVDVVIEEAPLLDQYLSQSSTNSDCTGENSFIDDKYLREAPSKETTNQVPEYLLHIEEDTSEQYFNDPLDVSAEDKLEERSFEYAVSVNVHDQTIDGVIKDAVIGMHQSLNESRLMVTSYDPLDSSISTLSPDTSNELFAGDPNISDISISDEDNQLFENNIPDVIVTNETEEITNLDYTNPLELADTTFDTGGVRIASLQEQPYQISYSSKDIALKDTNEATLTKQEKPEIDFDIVTSTPREDTDAPSHTKNFTAIGETSIEITIQPEYLDAPISFDDSSYSLVDSEIQPNTDTIKLAAISLQVTPRDQGIKTAPCTPQPARKKIIREHKSLVKSNSWQYKADYNLSRNSQLLMESLEQEMENEEPLEDFNLSQNVLDEIFKVKSNLKRVAPQQLFNSDDSIPSLKDNETANLFKPLSFYNNDSTRRYPSESSLGMLPKTLLLKPYGENKRISRSLHNIFTDDDLETDIDEVDEKELLDVLASPCLPDTSPDVQVTDVDKMISISMEDVSTRRFSRRYVIVSKTERRYSEKSLSDDTPPTSPKETQESKGPEQLNKKEETKEIETDEIINVSNDVVSEVPNENNNIEISLADEKATIQNLHRTNEESKKGQIIEDIVSTLEAETSESTPVTVTIPAEVFNIKSKERCPDEKDLSIMNPSIKSLKLQETIELNNNHSNRSSKNIRDSWDMSAKYNSKGNRDSWDVFDKSPKHQTDIKKQVEKGVIHRSISNDKNSVHKHKSWNILDLKPEEDDNLELFIAHRAELKGNDQRDATDISYLFEKYQREREAIKRMNENNADSLSEFSDISSVSSAHSQDDILYEHIGPIDESPLSHANAIKFNHNSSFSPIEYLSDDEIERLRLFQYQTESTKETSLYAMNKSSSSKNSPSKQTEHEITSSRELTETVVKPLPSPTKPSFVPEMSTFSDDDLSTLVLAQAASAVRNRRRGGRGRAEQQRKELTNSPDQTIDIKTSDSGISDGSNNLSPLEQRSTNFLATNLMQPAVLRRSQELWSLNFVNDDANPFQETSENSGRLSTQNVTRHNATDLSNKRNHSTPSRQSSTSTLQSNDSGTKQRIASDGTIGRKNDKQNHEHVSSLPNLHFANRLSSEDLDAYETEEFFSESSVLSDDCFDQIIKDEQYIYPSLHLRTSSNSSTKFHADSDSSGDESFSTEDHIEYSDMRLHDTERTVYCGNPPCSKQQILIGNERSLFTSCPSCFTCYCSRECRKSHWKEHKRICFYGRISYYVRSFMRRCEREEQFNSYLKSLALGSSKILGRGCLMINFESPTEAKIALVSKNISLSTSPVYTTLDNIQNENIQNRHTHLLSQTLQDYDQEQEFVVNLSIVIGDKNTSNKKRKSTVVRCARISILHSRSSTSSLSSYVIRTFTLPTNFTAEYINDMEARRYYCREISFGLKRCGVRLKAEYPDAYEKLCRYVEQEVVFLPLVLYGQRDTRNYKCVLYPGHINSAEEAHGEGVLV